MGETLKAFHCRWGSVIWRGALYFLIPFLAIMGEKLTPFAEKDEWPSMIRVLVMLMVASGAGLVALRAYFDGSWQRHADDLKRSDTTPPFRT